MKNANLQTISEEEIDLVIGAACFGCQCICRDGWGFLYNAGGAASDQACEWRCWPNEMLNCYCPK